MHFDFDDNQQGATHDPDDRLKGEILAALSDWSAAYETEGLELAWTVHQMLMQHINRNQGLAAYIEFAEKAGAMMGKEADAIKEVIEKDYQLHQAH